jgi:pimeloyl-ACP methyl ester carboxylesterase
MRPVRASSSLEQVNGLALHLHRFVDDQAPPSGLTVLLVHGFMDTGGTWDLVAEPLTRAGHEVLAPDLRGFGSSQRVGAGGYYHFPDYVGDIAALVDRLSPARLAVVGHSMGGVVSAIYAGACSERIERLVLIEGLGTVGTDPDIAIDRMQTWLRQMKELDRTPKELSTMSEAISRLVRNHPRVPREILASRAPRLTVTDAQGRLVWAYDPMHRTRSPTPFQPEVFKAFLRRISCPTLIVSGGPTGWHAPDEAERLVCIARATTLEFPDAGHMLHWVVPGDLAQALNDFFASPQG